ncbi:phosphatase PAP2 family protein [Streptomyces sp. SLBN-31]|uniref:phosphatase PAP2 family protein n=1 Tax=Streptomyces sp. SLBN-31 TaxID=2768444 RepID=UPI001166CEA0|nr:phosphatase PAP2 family protein [Streptomyces sp. SLBN-31]TQJ90971.1 undecaprenyl-diphosphatase [Streptomyces sp. SLBN-31]
MNEAWRAVRSGTVRAGVLCAALFGCLAVLVGVRHGSPLPGDGAVHTWAIGHRPPVAQALARGITATGTGIWPYLVVAVAGLIAGRDAGERLRTVPCALAVLLAGQLLREAVMESFARARPDPADWAAYASGYAFPSGHTTTSALAAGLLCWAVTRRSRPDLARTTCVLAVCWAAAVGATRVYLGVHWTSDVLGGWLLATAWLSLCGWGLTRWRPRWWRPAGDSGPTPRDTEPPRTPAAPSRPSPEPPPAPTSPED